MKECDYDIDHWPSKICVDIGVYLFFCNRTYTRDQLRDYKNLDCYQKNCKWMRMRDLRQETARSDTGVDWKGMYIKLPSNCSMSITAL